jgi:hypothetical protein
LAEVVWNPSLVLIDPDGEDGPSIDKFKLKSTRFSSSSSSSFSSTLPSEKQGFLVVGERRAVTFASLRSAVCAVRNAINSAASNFAAAIFPILLARISAVDDVRVNHAVNRSTSGDARLSATVEPSGGPLAVLTWVVEDGTIESACPEVETGGGGTGSD